jgi:hypothetical protein
MRGLIRRMFISVCLAVGVVACSSGTAPPPLPPPPTLMLTNPTCGPTGCRTIQARIFDYNLILAQNPLGEWPVGTVQGPIGCLALPVAWRLAIVNSPTDTTWIDLSDEDPLRIIIVDSTLLSGGPGNPDSTILGFTAVFTPATAAGWTASFTGSTASETPVSGAPACTP